jgi:hypothetical protein
MICVYGIMKELIPLGSRDGYEWEIYLNGKVTRNVALSLAGAEKRKHIVSRKYTYTGNLRR